MDPSQLGWGQQEPGSRGCCWKLAPRLDPKGALAGKAQMSQTQPLSGCGGSAWAPRTAAVRGLALSVVLKPGVCGRRAGRGRFRLHDLCPRPRWRRAGSEVWGAADSLGEAVRGGEDPPVRDEAAPAEVTSVSLNADLPGPLALQGVLPAHHPVQHSRAPAGWGNRAGEGLGGAPWRPILSALIPTPKPTLGLSSPVHILTFLPLTGPRTLGLSRRPGHQSASDAGCEPLAPHL